MTELFSETKSELLTPDTTLAECAANSIVKTLSTRLTHYSVFAGLDNGNRTTASCLTVAHAAFKLASMMARVESLLVIDRGHLSLGIVCEDESADIVQGYSKNVEEEERLRLEIATLEPDYIRSKNLASNLAVMLSMGRILGYVPQKGGPVFPVASFGDRFPIFGNVDYALAVNEAIEPTLVAIIGLQRFESDDMHSANPSWAGFLEKHGRYLPRFGNYTQSDVE